MPTAIEFNNVSKLYRLGLVSSGTLSNDLKRWWQMNILGKEDPFMKVGSVNDRSKAADSEYVWALKDIDFKVEQGDVVGIIGKNGAGKSTLLKLLSKVTGPTTGSIRAKGRIASLLEVGTGFHGELTGRENIYMNGAILGMSKQEINSKIDEIVAFSGCERYIDTPVKRYSSGMTVRLGFAVAAHLDPEILVVDEVLAVGDAEFQKKAIGKMQDVSKGEGRTVLFVSHNMASIRRLCKTCVLLSNGIVEDKGNTDDIIELYLKKDYNQVSLRVRDRKDRVGDGKFVIDEITVNGIADNITVHDDNTPYNIGIKLRCNEVVNQPRICVSINSATQMHIFFFDSQTVENVPSVFDKEYVNLSIQLPDCVSLHSGSYYINVACYSMNQMCDYIQQAVTFNVMPGNFYYMGRQPGGSEMKVMIKENWRFE